MTNKSAWGVIITIILASIGVFIFLCGKIIIKENPSLADKIGLSDYIELASEDVALEGQDNDVNAVEVVSPQVDEAEDFNAEVANDEVSEDIVKEEEPDNSNNIDTGQSEIANEIPDQWVLNINEFSRKIHYPSCEYVPKISPQNYSTSTLSISELERMGYSPCRMCFK